MHFQLEKKTGVTTRSSNLGTLITKAYLLLETAGSSREMVSACLLMGRAEKKIIISD